MSVVGVANKTNLNLRRLILIFSGIAFSAVAGQAQNDGSVDRSIASLFATKSSLQQILTSAELIQRLHLSAREVDFLDRKLKEINNQTIDRVETVSERELVFRRGRDCLRVQAKSGAGLRVPASSSESPAELVFNGHGLATNPSESLEDGWARMQNEIKMLRAKDRSRFARPSVAADFELDETPVSWMPSPHRFSEERHSTDAADSYFVALAVLTSRALQIDAGRSPGNRQ